MFMFTVSPPNGGSRLFSGGIAPLLEGSHLFNGELTPRLLRYNAFPRTAVPDVETRLCTFRVRKRGPGSHTCASMLAMTQQCHTWHSKLNQN